MGEKIAAIVLAAGEGKRMGSGIPKQYMLIKSRPLVYYALKAFEESAVDEVILVTGEDEIDYCKEYIVDRYHFNKVKKIVPGGWERYASVYFGLEAIEDADYVLIHDGARPMISAELIQKCIYYVKKYRACVVGMPSKDTIKVVDEENYAIRTPERYGRFSIYGSIGIEKWCSYISCNIACQYRGIFQRIFDRRISAKIRSV